MVCVFFDWDGTLVDSLPLLFESHNHVRREMGHKPWTMDEYRAIIVYSTRELYPRLYGDQSDTAQKMLYDYIVANHLQRLILLDGAQDLIETLATMKVPMGVVSNKRHDVLRREVEHLGWQKYFHVYNGAGVASADKPDAAPLLFAISQHPARPSIDDIIYVGDTESDLGCANAAGCPCAYIRHDLGQTDLETRFKPLIAVNNVVELKEKLINYVTLSEKKPLAAGR